MSLPLEYNVTLPDGNKFSQPSGLFINNEFVKSKSGKTIESINPSTGEVNGSVYAADEEDVDSAVKHARNAFHAVWRKTTGVARGDLLNKFAQVLQEQRDLIGAIEAWDWERPKNRMPCMILMNALIVLNILPDGLTKFKEK